MIRRLAKRYVGVACGSATLSGAYARVARSIYIGNPDAEGRWALIQHLLKKDKHGLTKSQLQQVVQLTDGYSAADLRTLCQEAAMGRELSFTAGILNDCTVRLMVCAVDVLILRSIA